MSYYGSVGLSLAQRLANICYIPQVLPTVGPMLVAIWVVSLLASIAYMYFGLVYISFLQRPAVFLVIDIGLLCISITKAEPPSQTLYMKSQGQEHYAHVCLFVGLIQISLHALFYQDLFNWLLWAVL